MKIAMLLAPYSRFGDDGASAVDLCVRDGVLHGRYGATTRIYGPAHPAPFQGIDFRAVGGYPAGHADRRSLGYVDAFVTALGAEPADLIVMQDDWRAAGRLAGRTRAPVVFHTHTYMKRRKGLDRFDRLRQMRRLAGMIFVSDNARLAFRESWGEPCPGWTGLNGIDATQWTPRPPDAREKEIAFIGRCVGWKGVIEAVEAMRVVLAARPGWRARFVLANLTQEPDYAARCIAAIEGLGPGAVLETEARHDRVREVCETAAIGLAPSLYNESFSRVSIEFLSGGAALVSSGAGGMREASGDAAVYVEPSPQRLAEAVLALIDDEGRRADLAARGRARVLGPIDIRRTTAAIDDIYDAVMARTRGGTA